MPKKHMPHRRAVKVRRVDECETLDDIFRHCLPAFGGAFLRMHPAGSGDGVVNTRRGSQAGAVLEIAE